jgi:hypothetical protein
MNKFIII